jgi:hypothetical protein
MQFDQLKRREFIALLGGAAAAWPLAARAEQADRVRRIGVLMAASENDPERQAFVAAFREQLQKLGWTDGRNVRFDIRWAATDAALLQRFAKELVALQPDLILSHNTPTTAGLLQQTRTIPIIFAAVSDPIGSGFVASFPRPGGNITGFTNIEPTMSGKWVELLKEIAPRVCRDGLHNLPGHHRSGRNTALVRDAHAPSTKRAQTSHCNKIDCDGGNYAGRAGFRRTYPSSLSWYRPAGFPYRRWALVALALRRHGLCATKRHSLDDNRRDRGSGRQYRRRRFSIGHSAYCRPRRDHVGHSPHGASAR